MADMTLTYNGMTVTATLNDQAVLALVTMQKDNSGGQATEEQALGIVLDNAAYRITEEAAMYKIQQATRQAAEKAEEQADSLRYVAPERWTPEPPIEEPEAQPDGGGIQTFGDTTQS